MSRKPAPLDQAETDQASFFRRVYEWLRHVPVGHVVTYGQIASALGHPRGARVVGWAMRACPEDVPWQRVVNARGGLSTCQYDGGRELHRALLEEEGIHFEADGHIDLAVYQWKGPHGE